MTDRGVSTTIDYVLGLTIATLLLGALIGTTGGFVGNQQESAIRSELRVVGERFAASLMTVDRLVQAGGTTVELDTTMPDRVAGSTYSVEVNATGSEIVLESHDPEITVTVPFTNTTAIEPVNVNGGDLQIVLDDDGDLEVQQA